MKITTWNINGVKARLESARRLPQARRSPTSSACRRSRASTRLSRRRLRGPRLPLRRTRPEGLQRRRHPIEAAARGGAYAGCPATMPTISRAIIEAVISVPSRHRQGRVDLPAERQPDRHREIPYKLAWMSRLSEHFRRLLARGDPVRPGGRLQRHPRADRRQAPGGVDQRRAVPAGDARRLSQAPQRLGLTDAIRACHPGPGVYTFWDYQAGALQKDDGIRIDHLLLSPQATDRLLSAGVDRFTRAWEKPSDHVPAWVELDV